MTSERSSEREWMVTNRSKKIENICNYTLSTTGNLWADQTDKQIGTTTPPNTADGTNHTVYSVDECKRIFGLDTHRGTTDITVC